MAEIHVQLELLNFVNLSFLLSSEDSVARIRCSFHFMKSERATPFPSFPFIGLLLELIVNGMVRSLPNKLLSKRYHFTEASRYTDGTGVSLGVRSTKYQILVSSFISFVTRGQISQQL